MAHLDLDKALKHRLILIRGDDSSLRLDALRQIVAGATDGEVAESQSTTADSLAPIEWIAAVQTAPFLAPRRVLVVRNLWRIDPRDESELPNPESFRAELASLPEWALLILVGDDDTRADRKRDSDPLPRWSAIVKAAGGLDLDMAYDAAKVRVLVEEAAKAHGKKIANAAVSKLIEMVAGRAGLALDEVEKLALYVGAAPEIREADVLAVVTPEQEYNVFALMDAVLAGNSGAGLTQLRRMFGRSGKVSDEAFSRVFPAINKQIRLLWQARLCVEAKCSAAKPTQDVLDSLPSSPNITGEKDWLQGKLMRTAGRVDFKALRRCQEILIDADARMKGLRPAHSDYETLEQMTLRLAEACSKN